MVMPSQASLWFLLAEGAGKATVAIERADSLGSVIGTTQAEKDSQPGKSRLEMLVGPRYQHDLSSDGMIDLIKRDSTPAKHESRSRNSTCANENAYMGVETPRRSRI
jgi:hypothetical protein